MHELIYFRAGLRARFGAALGLASALASAACASPGDSASTTDTTSPGGSDSTSTTGTSGDETTAATTTGTTDDPTTTTTTTTDDSTTTTGVDETTSTSTGDDPGMQDVERCFFYDGAECPPISTAILFFNCTDQDEQVELWIDGPTTVDGLCCYQVEVTAPGHPNCVDALVGPLVVDGESHVAPVGLRLRG